MPLLARRLHLRVDEHRRCRHHEIESAEVADGGVDERIEIFIV